MSGAAGLLARILELTREAVAERKRRLSIESMQRRMPTPSGRRPFAAAISRPGEVNIVAEFKRRSPSRGVIREDLHPVQVAQAYEVAGAAALSVLTEERFFGGHLDDLREARGATLLPTLRKDFIVDPYQIWEAWYAGADAVLLIVAALADQELQTLLATTAEMGLDAQVEVHDREDLSRALSAGARIVGVNNRDLRTMEVRLETSFDLAPLIPDDVVAVSESGITKASELRRLREVGYDAFLIGEHLMLSDPGPTLEALIRESSTMRWPGRAVRQGRRVSIKVCGITTPEDGLLAAAAGADAVGLVFWPGSPRAVSVEAARRITRALPPFVLRVGVFVDETRETLAATAEEVGLDLLQLHGSEGPEIFRDLPRRALKAVRVGEDFLPEEALRFEGVADGILLDTARGFPTDGPPGGTGMPFDWTRVREVRQKATFLVLAGGLTAENVKMALTTVRPDAVDVSSGVESSPGHKDPHKLRAFVDAVRGAER